MRSLKILRFITILCFILVVGCAVDRNVLSESEKNELKEWTIVGDTLLRNNIPVAVYDHTEYEMYMEKTTKEISIIQIDGNPENTIPLMKFIHHSHKKDKVEIVIKK
jgi:hypothetical protein